MVDFWRMVWEQNSATVVMLTNVVEREKVLTQWPPDNHMTVR